MQSKSDAAWDAFYRRLKAEQKARSAYSRAARKTRYALEKWQKIRAAEKNHGSQDTEPKGEEAGAPKDTEE